MHNISSPWTFNGAQIDYWNHRSSEKNSIFACHWHTRSRKNATNVRHHFSTEQRLRPNSRYPSSFPNDCHAIVYGNNGNYRPSAVGERDGVAIEQYDKLRVHRVVSRAKSGDYLRYHCENVRLITNWTRIVKLKETVVCFKNA